MADEPLIEPLGLDIQPALDALDPLGQKLTELATGFADSLTEALGTLGAAPPVVVTADTTELDVGIADALDAPRPPIAVDADGVLLSTEIAAAVADAPIAPVTVDGDTTSLETAIQDTVGQDVAPIVISGDTSELTTSIQDATSNIDATVPVNADVTELQNTLAALTTAPIELQVEADTTTAQAEIDALGQSATDAIGTSGGASSGGGGGGGSGLEGLAGVVGNFSNVAPVAQGETQGLVASIAGLSPASAVAAGGVVALGAFIGDVTNQAAEAQAQTNRFNQTFGALADQVNHINVGGLNITLKELGDQSATSSTQLDSAASRIGEMGRSAGAAGPRIVDTTTGILALAGAASVTNPELGNTANVADRLSRLLQSGGPRLAQYGISLSAAAVRTEALRENTGKTAAALTPFDKLVAGTTLALAQQGDTLGSKFAAGAQNAQIQLRSLKVQLDETLTSAGGPLLAPLVTSLKEVLPVAQTLGEALGNLASVVFPAIGAAAGVIGILTQPLKLVSDGLHAIGSAIALIPEPVLVGIAAGFTAIGIALGVFDGAIAALLNLSGVGEVLLGISVAVAAIGAVVDIFGNSSHLAAVDTTELDQALLQTSQSAGAATGVLDSLSSSVDKYLQKQLQVQVAGQSELATANAVGLSQKALTTALEGTTAQYDAVTQTIKDNEAATIDAAKATASGGTGLGEDANKRAQAKVAIDNQTDSYKNLLNTLEQGRQKLEDNAQFALNDAVSTGALTRAQLQAAEAASKAGGKTADYLTILQQFAPQIDLFNAKTQATALAASESSDAFGKLVPQIAAGAVTANDATTQSAKLGLSVQDTTKFINDETKAVTEAKDKQTLASDAVKQLAEQFQGGGLSAANLEAKLLDLGLSVGGADSLIQQLQKDVVPLTDAQDRAAASVLRMQPGYAALVDGLARGTITSQDARIGFEQLGLSLDTAGSFVKSLQSTVDSAVSGIVGNLPQASKAATQWGQDISSAFQTASSDAKSGSKNIAADLAALAANKDPQKFFDNLVKQSFQIAAFEDNVKKLIHEGLGNFAGFLAQQPIDVAAPLAAAVASDPAKAKVRAGVFQLAQEVSGPQAKAFFEAHAKQLGLDGGAQILDGLTVDPGAVNGVAGAVARGLSAHFSDALTLRTTTSAALAAAATAMQHDATIGRAAGQLGLNAVDAFKGTLTPAQAVTLALTTAHDAIANDPTLAAASGQLGTTTAAALGKGANIKGTVQNQINQAAAIVPQLVNLPNVVGLLGVQAGEAFGQGLANGIDQKSPVVVTSATKIANAAVKAVRDAHITKSPSQVAILLGQQFSAGLALGINDGSVSVALASQDVAQAAIAALHAALGTATTAGATAASQLVSSAASALPTVSTAVSTFAQALAKAISSEQTAKVALARETQRQAIDRAKETELLKQTGISYGVLSRAQAAYNAVNKTTTAASSASRTASDKGAKAAAQANVDAAARAVAQFKTVAEQSSPAATAAIRTLAAAKAAYDSLTTSSSRTATKAQHDSVTAAKQALDAAQKQFDHFNSALTAQTKVTAASLARLTAAQKQFTAISKQLAADRSGQTFINDLNQQTRAAREFAANIAKLTREGFVGLAQNLAAQGPTAAGALARAFARSSAKAKSAEAAVDHATAFAKSYQATLERLFGPGGAAAGAAGTAGTAVGQALTQGLKITVASGVAATVGQVSKQIGQIPKAAATNKIDLTPGVRTLLGPPQKAVPPVPLGGTAVQVLPFASSAAAAGPQRLALDLTVNLEDGTTVHAFTEVPIPPSPSLNSRVTAEVHAS